MGSKAALHQQAFNPDRFGSAQFPAVRTYVPKKVLEAATLSAALLADKKAANAQDGTAAGVGAVIIGTDLRDVTSTVGFGACTLLNP